MQDHVITVTGVQDPQQLGITMMHEHLLIDLTCHFVEPEEASYRGLRDHPVSMPLLGRLHRRPFSTTLDNLLLTDENAAVEEAFDYVREGGRTIVDVTTIGLARDPLALFHIANVTGLNIVMGTGCYVETAHPPWVSEATLEELRDLFIRDIIQGVGDTRICAGIIGEIGTSGVRKTSTGRSRKEGDITSEEEKVLRAAGQAAVATGLAVTVHLDVRGHGAFRAIEILADEGLDSRRMVMDHVDALQDYEYLCAIAQEGAYVEFDTLGRDYYIEEIDQKGHDTWRVEHLAKLISSGFADRIVLSHDICMKIDLRKYGGVGYGHILRSIVPMLRQSGVSDDAINQILVENPKEILTVKKESVASANDGKEILAGSP